MTVIDKAKEKLSKELESFTGGQKEKAISTYVEKTLKEFCNDEAFAKVVFESEKTLSDCCSEIMKGVGGYISDLDVYKKAAQFYFPGSKIDFTMTIKTGDAPTVIETKEKPVKTTQNKENKQEKQANDIQISLFAL